MRTRRIGIALLSTAALLHPAWAAGQVPSFTYRQTIDAQSFAFGLSSSEWVEDEFDGDHEYAPNLDQRVRLFANPWGRSGTLTFSSTRPLNLFPGDTADAVEFGWHDLAPAQVATGATTPAPTALDVAPSGLRSLMQPGLRFRFRTGPAPASRTGDSEDEGFAFLKFIVIPGSTMGNAQVPMLLPYERAVVALQAEDDIVDMILPARASNERTTVAAWLQIVDDFASFVGVWARCNAFPDAANFDARQFFGTSFPIFMELPECQGNWFITISSTHSARRTVHLTASAHLTNRAIPFVRVGVNFAATQNELDGIIYGLRSAAWRLYGMTMGTTFIREFWIYNNSSCSRIDGCGTGCNICISTANCTTNVSTFDGFMMVCNNEASVLRTNDHAQIDRESLSLGAPAYTIAHEFGHQWMAQPDEYWIVAGCSGGLSGGGYGLCGYTIMATQTNNNHSFCTDLNHRTHVHDDRNFPFAPNRIAGPNGFDCNGTAGWVDATSGWSRISSLVPGGVLPSFSPQNLNYISQQFAEHTTWMGHGCLGPCP